MKSPSWLPLAGKSLKQNTPAILSGLAVAGVVITAILAAQGTPKAQSALIDAQDNEREDLESVESKLEPIAILKACWRPYLPATISGVATIACILGANRSGARQTAAMASAYTLASSTLMDYKKEIISQFTEGKERKIHDETVKHKIDQQPVTTSQVFITAGGDQLCYDTLSGRYFKSDAETIRRAENELDHRILSDMYATLNDFYELLGLAPIDLGDLLGFNIDHRIKLVFTSHLADDGRPCLAIGHEIFPIAEYGKF